jgi:hypothetical protein
MSRQVSRKVTQQAATAPCPSCGRLNPAGAQTCWACRAPLHPAVGPPVPISPGAAVVPPPAGGPAVLEVNLSDLDEGPLPPPAEKNAFGAPLKTAARQPKGSLWTRRLSFGLEGQPYCAGAVRMAILAGTLFPPLFLVAVVQALIGIVRHEPSAPKVLGWILVIGLVYWGLMALLLEAIIHSLAHMSLGSLGMG